MLTTICVCSFFTLVLSALTYVSVCLVENEKTRKVIYKIVGIE